MNRTPQLSISSIGRSWVKASTAAIQRALLGVGERNEADGFAGLDDEGKLSAIVTVRRATAAEFVAENIVLNEGELAIEVDGSGNPIAVRMGDGVTVGGIRRVYGSKVEIVDSSTGLVGEITLANGVFSLSSGGATTRLAVSELLVNNKLLYNATTAASAGTGTTWHDWNPGSIVDRPRYHVQLEAAVEVTGLVGSGGQTIEVLNTPAFGTPDLTIKHLDTGSTSGNRIYCPGAVDLVVPAHRTVRFWKFTSASPQNWRASLI
jgi:hypothetical protein